MTQGRKPIPMDLIKQRGTRTQPGRDSEIPTTDGRPEKPEGLSQLVSEKWEFVLNHLEGAGILSSTDAEVIIRYCLLCEEVSFLNESIHELKGKVVYRSDGRSGFTVKPYPQYKLRRDCFTEMTKLEVMLVLNPEGRARSGTANVRPNKPKGIDVLNAAS